MLFTGKKGKLICSHEASASRGIDAIARYKARKSRVTSRVGCSLTYLQFAGDFTRGMIADCLQLQVLSGVIAGIFAYDSACIFARMWRVFLTAFQVFLPATCMYFFLLAQASLHASSRQVCISSLCKITCKLPVMVK